MSILVQKAGILDTIQDLGRHGYAQLGIHTSGSADPLALQVANMVVGNASGTAGLEMHFPASTLRFEQDAVFALGGADFDARLNGKELSCWTPVVAAAGSELAFRKQQHGARAYLAVQSGFDLEPWLGSCSTSLPAGAGGWKGRALQAGDILPLINGAGNSLKQGTSVCWRVNVSGLYAPAPLLRFLPGPEYHLLNDRSLDHLSSAIWRLSSQSNRMACKLEGPLLQLRRPFELVSSAMQPGTVQLLPSGELLVLMADCQTTGGYPRIAQIFQADLPGLAQWRPGSTFQLQQSSLENATAAARVQRQLLRQLHWGCSFMWK